MRTVDKDLEALAADVVASGQPLELPEQGVVILPLADWSRLRRVEAMRAVTELGRCVGLTRVNVEDLLRREREARTDRLLDGHGRR